MPTKRPTLRIGTRGSALARWQAEWIAAELTLLGHAVQLVPIKTQGDVTTGSLKQSGGVGLFTKELQRALLDERIDVAVHSLKDLPTAPVPGLALAAVPRRAPTGDCLVIRESLGVRDDAPALASLPPEAVIGTGSVRRRAQLLHARPDLDIRDIRGNVETRLSKLDAGDYDAIVLAQAGLVRLGFVERATQVLPAEIMLPAVGQGALGIEARAEDGVILDRLRPLNDAASFAAVTAERRLLLALRAGCLAPVGALAQDGDGRLVLEAVVLSARGERRITARSAGERNAAESLGQRVAEELLASGAAELIQAEHA